MVDLPAPFSPRNDQGRADYVLNRQTLDQKVLEPPQGPERHWQMELGRNQPRASWYVRDCRSGTARCRLHGPSKTNVADIARLPGKSPASVYKVFPLLLRYGMPLPGNFFESDLCFTRLRRSRIVIFFKTVEDETGIANVVIWPKLFEQSR